ncbi:MAG: DUF3841 domain-containing protein [Bacillota bacterium]
MRLWSIVPISSYVQLLNSKKLRSGPGYPKYNDEVAVCHLDATHQWLSEQIVLRIGLPPKGVDHPVWAWHTLDGRHEKPDLRRSEFRIFREDQICLEIEIPHEKVVLIDAESLRMILNDEYCYDVGFEAELVWYDRLPIEQKQRAKLASWDRAFNVFDKGHPCLFIHAALWEIDISQVIGAKRFSGRREGAALKSMAGFGR